MKQPASELLAYIRSIDLFDQLDESIQHELAGSLEQNLIAPDEYLFRQGDPGHDGMYIILEGRLRVLVTQPDGHELMVDERHAGEILGEIGMLTGSRRTASVQTVSPTKVAKISKASFDQLVEKSPEILSQVSEIVLRRLRRPQLVATLSNLFGSLDLATIEDIQAELTWLHLPRGESLIRQGEMDKTLYLLVSGRLQAVASDEAGNEHVVGEIMAGETVGEMQILTGDARSVSVYGIRDSQLVKLSKAGFDRLAEKYPQIQQHLTQLVIKRLQQTIHASSSTRPKLALDLVIVPAGPDVPLSDFTQRLAVALEKFGPTLVVNNRNLDDHLGVPNAAYVKQNSTNDIRLSIWLTEQAARYSFRLYETDFTVTDWTKRCLHQADQVLIVGWAQSDPSLSDLEAEILAEKTELGSVLKRLVLLHPETTAQATGTINWLTPRQIRQHHHVRWDQKADFARLARFLTERTIGLVLGSGGARGFAHIGVLRAIQEIGLKIDLIGGTSFGAMIGALYAMGYDYEQLYQQAKALANPKLIADYTVPLTSFLAGQKFTNLMQVLFSDRQIEDAWTDFFCVSSNLTKATQVVHQQGPLWKHIRSSCSIPMVFPPSIFEGELLVDGGLINTIPLDIMKQLSKSGVIIGVDVSTEEDLAGEYQFDSSISGWSVLWSRLNPFKAAIKTPPLLPILMRVTELQSSSRRKSQSALADVYIRPPVEKFDTLDWGNYEEIIERGYRTALPQLETWLSNQQPRP